MHSSNTLHTDWIRIRISHRTHLYPLSVDAVHTNSFISGTIRISLKRQYPIAEFHPQHIDTNFETIT